MASFSRSGGCPHSIQHPYAGMRLSERTDDTISFECPACGERYVASRCAATNAKNGAACKSAALSGFATCRMHRRAEKLGLIPRRDGASS